MAKISGNQLYATFGSTLLNGSQRSFDVKETMDQADSTAGSDSYRNFVNTVKTIEVDAEIIVQDGTAGSALRAALVPGSQGTLIWGVEGTAAGKPKKGFFATVSDSSESIPYDDVLLIKAKFTMAGTALAFNGYSSVWP